MPKTKTARTLTVIFSDDKYPNLKVTWIMGSRVLRLLTSGGPQEGPRVMGTHAFKNPSIERFEDEAEKWLDAIDVFDHEEDGHGDEDDYDV